MAREKVSDAHKKAVRQLWQSNRKAEKQRQKTSKATAALGVNSEDLLEFCSYCGTTNALRHPHRSNRCVECGKLYERWRKARRLGITAELRILKPVLLQRMDRARSVDKWATRRIDNFYKQVKETEIMEQIMTHKVCKQCGRRLPIVDFRQYKARGTGAYKTTQGHYTICKVCESISGRAAAALRTGNQETIEKLTAYYKDLADRGLPPVTAAAKRLLGIEASKTARTNDLDDLLAATLGTSASGAVDEFCEKLRRRDFVSVDDAYDRLKALAEDLRAAGVYDDMNELLEEWFDDDDA